MTFAMVAMWVLVGLLVGLLAGLVLKGRRLRAEVGRFARSRRERRGERDRLAAGDRSRRGGGCGGDRRIRRRGDPDRRPANDLADHRPVTERHVRPDAVAMALVTANWRPLRCGPILR